MFYIILVPVKNGDGTMCVVDVELVHGKQHQDNAQSLVVVIEHVQMVAVADIPAVLLGLVGEHQVLDVRLNQEHYINRRKGLFLFFF